MNRKRLLVLLSAFIIIIVVSLIPFNKQVIIPIDASYVNCYQQLEGPRFWKNWNPQINASSGNQYSKNIDSIKEFKLSTKNGNIEVTKKFSNFFLISNVNDNKDFVYSYNIFPNSTGLGCSVAVSFKINGWSYLFTAFGNNRLKETRIYDFKDYMENVRRFYGFNIKQGFELEKNVIVEKRVVHNKDVFTKGNEMQKELKDFMHSQKLEQTDSLIAQFLPKNKDSVQLFVGIPVNKQIKSTNNILYMSIPSTKIIMADFKGNYQDKQKVYDAAGRYIQDRFLHPKIAPLEIFKSAFPTNASDKISVQLVYPIF